MAVRERTPSTLDVSLDIAAPADIVFDAFFQDRALSVWLRTSRTIAVPRLLGPYVLEWQSGTGRDDTAGPGTGVLRGSVMHVEPGSRLFAADVYWLPLDAEPLGPLALEVTFGPTAQSGSLSTLVRVVISGFDQGARWKQYHGSATAQWQRGLRGLKTLLEK
jgi:uncharacterized protein YndB with AHSA1/START domain